MADYKICAFCGKPTRIVHHLVFGYGLRPLADEDGLVINLCEDCHTANVKPADRLHDNHVAEILSKMLGQCMWEKKAILDGYTENDARELFRKRYGRSWL